MNRPGRCILLCGLLALACAHTSSSPVERRAQEDGTYRVDCRLSLARCLASIEQVCGKGYEILRGRETRSMSGPIEPNEPLVVSEVVARCRTDTLFRGAEKPSPPAASGVGGVAPASASRSCTPGATQACVGPAACHGGQQCLADGMAFGPCDCGGAAPAAPTVSPAVPDAPTATPR